MRDDDQGLGAVRPGRVLWGRVTAAYLRAGWRPPPPSARIVRAIAEDVERLDRREARLLGSGRRATTLELAPFELRALALAAEGYGRAELARRAGVSEESVKSSLRSLRRKLGARNTTHAVALAIRRGLI